MNAKRVLRDAIAPVVDLVYPPRCPVCGSAIGAQTGLCAPCWSDLRIPADPSCVLCQRPLMSDSVAPGAICAPCMVNPPLHDGIAAGTLYGDAPRKLVLAFKHGRRIALAPMLARLIAARLPVLDGEWIIVPVPLHRWRLWRRGYNQAALLGRELARLTGARLVVDGLVRTRRTPMLGGLGKAARAQTLKGALALNPARAANLKGAQVILVDDVLTSGATSSECVRLLRQAGASRVRIACFSRVMDEAESFTGQSQRQDAIRSSPPQTETPGA